jgi:hypothetical protein
MQLRLCRWRALTVSGDSAYHLLLVVLSKSVASQFFKVILVLFPDGRFGEEPYSGQPYTSKHDSTKGVCPPPNAEECIVIVAVGDANIIVIVICVADSVTRLAKGDDKYSDYK